MKRIIGLMLAFALIGWYCRTAEASIFGSGLTFNGIQDIAVDESVGRIVDLGDGVGGGADGLASVGDIIQGVISFQSVSRDNAAGTYTYNTNGQTVWAVYSFIIDGIDTSTGIASLAPVPTGGAVDVYSISGILSDAGFSTAGLNDNPANAGIVDDAVIAVFGRTGTSDSLTDFLATGASLGDDAGGIGDVINPTDYDLEALLGHVASTDFHDVQVTNALFMSLSSVVAIPNSGVTLADFRGAYSVISHNFGGDTIFLPTAVDAYGGDVLDPSDDVLADVTTGANTTITSLGSTSGFITRGWHFKDDGEYKINTVPEPASILVWAIIGGAVAIPSWRRRSR